MSIDAIQQSNNPLVINAKAEVVKGGNENLSSQDFLQLLTVQLTNQDPLNPMEDTEFISQMANFTSLEQMSELTQSFNTFSSSQQEIASQAYLGKHVTIALPNAQNVSGLVTAVSRDSENNMLVTVNGQAYGLERIQSVTLPPQEQQAMEHAPAANPVQQLASNP